MLIQKKLGTALEYLMRSFNILENSQAKDNQLLQDVCANLVMVYKRLENLKERERFANISKNIANQSEN
jgi:hypothetical protein